MKRETLSLRSRMSMENEVRKNIKLARHSSAREFLYSKPGQNIMKNIVDAIHESEQPQYTSVTGKLPVEAAYTIMRRVIEEAGEPIMHSGLSTYNKLKSLRTEPSLKVLKSQSWRDFFVNYDATHRPGTSSSNRQSPTISRRPSSASLASKTSARPNSARSQIGNENSHDNPMEGSSVLETIFLSLKERVESLWLEIKMPLQEQKFYSKSMLNVPIISLDQCKDLADYLQILKDHKEATKVVLSNIAIREKAIKKCYDVLAAVHRKLKNSKGQLLSSRRPSSASLEATSTSQQQQRNNSSPNQFSFWKEELIFSLDNVRCATLEVIKSIQQWRRIMWRPQPFHWRGVNYLQKMRDDLTLLESESYIKILSIIPLNLADLQCLLFMDEDTIHTKRFASDPNAAGEDEHIASLVQEFRCNIEPDELAAAASVVLREGQLQNALAAEKVALNAKGVFIPLLRSSTGKKSATNTSSAPAGASDTLSHDYILNCPTTASQKFNLRDISVDEVSPSKPSVKISEQQQVDDTSIDLTRQGSLTGYEQEDFEHT